MLNRYKVLQELGQLAPTSYRSLLHEQQYTWSIWQQVCADPLFCQTLMTLNSPWSLPTWQGPLNSLIKLEKQLLPYQVIATDGSQIYPDRHQGINCSLINIGTVHFSYGSVAKPVSFSSMPSLYFGGGDDDRSIDLVNCKRTELELRTGLVLSKQADRHSPLLFLCDGSLIFWHLNSKEPEIKFRFLTSYITLLQQFYDARIPIAGYISLPQGKELINLLRYVIYKQGKTFQEAQAAFGFTSDLHVIQNYLTPDTRSIVFTHNSPLMHSYPDHLKPYFFYLNTGQEIARVEVPAWVANDKVYLTQVSNIICDQAYKGRGYPLALAEAHEQAVVKNDDREFFYTTLNTVLSQHQQYYAPSRKSFFKRGLSV